MKLVLMGPPGSGKGTQVINLCGIYGIQKISTGDILKEHIYRKTELGLAVEALMASGAYVPDELVIPMVKERVFSPECEKGFIFDGFPRTLAQAGAIEEMLKEGEGIDRVISLEVPAEAVVERLSGRMICRACKTPYHLSHKPPKQAGVCDCGGELTIRDDDRPETVKRRIEIYMEKTQPIIDYYRRKGLLLAVNGVGAPEAVTDSIVRGLGAKGI